MPQSAVPRNVFVFDANVPAGAEPSLVGGMFQFGQTTGVDFYLCLEICFHLPEQATFRLKAADGIILPRDGTPVRTGSYTVVTLGKYPPFSPFPLPDALADPPQNLSVTLTDETARHRIISRGSPSVHGVYTFLFNVDGRLHFSGTVFAKGIKFARSRERTLVRPLLG